MYVKMRCTPAGKITVIAPTFCPPRVITLDRTYGVGLRIHGATVFRHHDLVDSKPGRPVRFLLQLIVSSLSDVYIIAVDASSLRLD